MPEKQSPSLPKWPFLAGDAVLVALACFIVISSAKPMAALNIFACALSVILGMLIYITPFIIEHLTSQQHLKLIQARAEETLLKTAELTADLLKRTEAIHGDIMKCALNLKQAPAALEAKTEELLQVLESDQIATSVSELEVLFTRLEAIMSKLASTQSKSELPKIVENLESLHSQNRNPASEIKNILETALEEFRNELLDQLNDSESQRIQIKQPEVKKSIAAIDDETKPSLSSQKAKTAELNAQANLPHAKDNEPKTTNIPSNEQQAIIKSEDGATRLLVGAFIGISNKLYIRGDGPGLSWEKGIPMELVGIGKWEWKTYNATTTIHCKVLINDEQWTDSVNIEAEPNTTVETTASF